MSQSRRRPKGRPVVRGGAARTGRAATSAAAVARRFRAGRGVIGILGLGYVGLPLALRFAERGCRVLGFDIDAAKVDALGRGRSYINYIPDAAVRRARTLEATTDFTRAGEADALVLCVPTPLDKHREPDLSYVVRTAESIAPHLRPGQLVSLESTTWPGTTEEVLQPIIERTGLTVGRDVFLAYSPERQDPGNRTFGTHNIPKLVGGVTPACREVAMACYRGAVKRVVPVSSPKVAEAAKLLENIHRAVNIGLVNEMKMVADRMGFDIFEVIDAAATKPFGFVPYYPGPGLGGHCIPIDPFYLTWKARQYGVHTRFIELAGEINHAMPEWVLKKLIEGLNRNGRAVRGARVLVLGLAYKKNVDDLRESPSVELMHRLVGLGAEVDYSDPLIPVFPEIRRGRLDLASVDPTPKALKSYDAVLIGTDHDAFDWKRIARNAKLVIDTRGVYREPRDNVIRA